MKRINQILNQRKGIAKTAKAAVICEKSKKIIKKDFKINQLEVSKYQGQTLFITTTSPTDSQKIFQNKKKIIKKINNELNTNIERISFRLKD